MQCYRTNSSRRFIVLLYLDRPSSNAVFITAACVQTPLVEEVVVVHLEMETILEFLWATIPSSMLEHTSKSEIKIFKENYHFIIDNNTALIYVLALVPSPLPSNISIVILSAMFQLLQRLPGRQLF